MLVLSSMWGKEVGGEDSRGKIRFEKKIKKQLDYRLGNEARLKAIADLTRRNHDGQSLRNDLYRDGRTSKEFPIRPDSF